MESESNHTHYSELSKGIDALWGNNFEEADGYFIKQKDNNPRFALHYAEVSLVKSIISELASDREIAIQRFLFTVKLAEEQIKHLELGQRPKGRTEITKDNVHNFVLDAKIVYADAHIMLATLQVMEEQRVKGMLNMRKGWKIYRETLSTVKDIHDPDVIASLKFGAGLFYFLLSLIPPGIAQKAAALAGFSGGNKDLGLQYLRECYASQSIRSYLAGIVIAMNHLFLTPDLDPTASLPLIEEAEKMMASGMERYPTGSLFHAAAGLAKLETSKIDESIKFTQIAIDNCKHVTPFPAIFYRLLSNCYAMQFDWVKTAEVLQKSNEHILKAKSRNPWAITWNSLRLGAVYVMLDQPEKSRKYFQDTASIKLKDRWSEILIHQANRFLLNGGSFSMIELMVLTGHFDKVINFCSDARRNEILNLIEDMNQKAANLPPPPKSESGFKTWFSKKLNKAVVNDPKLDNKAAYLVLKSIVLKTLNRNDEAVANLTEVIQLEKQLEDKMYYALALFELGRVLAKTDPDTAIKNFELVMRIDDFAWETPVKTRVRASMRHLSKGKEENLVIETSDKDAEQLLAEDADLRELLQQEEKDSNS